MNNANQCVRINPLWSKGYARKGAALHGARKYDEAIAVYEAGIKLEDSPALRKGLQEVKDAKGSRTHYLFVLWLVNIYWFSRFFRRCGFRKAVFRPKPSWKVGDESQDGEASVRPIICSEGTV